jgi:hypothetical protein
MIPGWDPEPVQAAIARGQARFGEHGIEADMCLVALDENAAGAIVEALTSNDYACVVIGGGIRKHEPLLEFFEKVVNLVRQHATAQADLCRVARGRGQTAIRRRALAWRASTHNVTSSPTTK